MKQFLEGAVAIARTVSLCRPGVVAAYPITPQTHIVEELANLVESKKLNAEFINVESEHSAASCVLGASATGVRVYSSTSSQGLLLMTEVLFNIAGMRLPVVMCCVNRAVSAPINIWNDQQDIITVRDAGIILLFAENIQEACDLHIQAYKIAEDKNIMLPLIVNIDGYILSHGYEPVEFPSQELVDKFLPKYEPEYKLDVENPMTLGPLQGPEYYLESRYAIQDTMENEVMNKIEKVADEFTKTFGRKSFGFVEEYKLEDAETVFVAMGSICGTIKEAVDELRGSGEKVGVLRLITYRPFPKKILFDSLKKAKKVNVIEKAVSLGSNGILYTELTSLFYSRCVEENLPKFSGYVVGLGGRDVSKEEIIDIYKKNKDVEIEFLNIKKENLGSYI